MALSKEKRAFLIRTLGLERVERLEKELPAFKEMLEEVGVGFKASSAPQTFEQLDQVRDAANLGEVFQVVAQNVLADDTLSVEDKLAKIGEAVADLEERLGTIASKELGSPAAPYVEDLLTARPRTKETLSSIKQLDESRHPGAPYLRDLLEGNMVS